jgi:hypothetical protein
MTPIPDRILLHTTEDRRLPVDPHEIFFVDTDGGDTRVRTRHAEACTAGPFPLDSSGHAERDLPHRG